MCSMHDWNNTLCFKTSVAIDVDITLSSPMFLWHKVTPALVTGCIENQNIDLLKPGD